MEQFGPRTKEFQSFNNDLEQSFLLASIVSRAGKASMDELIAKIKATDDPAQIQELGKQGEEYLRLGRDTTPNVLFIFLMTKFEAYIEDILVSISIARPSLVALSEGDAEQLIRDQVTRLINNQRIDDIADRVFEQRFHIPFARICIAAKTSPNELDRAKAIRNIHIHNRGFVNARNQARIGNLEVGEYCPLAIEYIIDLKDKIFLTCLGVDKMATILYPETL